MTDNDQINYYLDHYWDLLVRNARSCRRLPSEITDDEENIRLPYDYVVPGGIFDTMFYWDSFFIMVGLRHSPRHRYLLKHMVDNCLYMVDHFGRVLNSNKKKWSSRSQLPFLTAMIRLVYAVYPDDTWLKHAMTLALKEYHGYWCSGNHLLENGLSRFYEDSGDNYQTRHTEASWDMSPRFDDDDTTDLAPVDLNANLYLYETNFAEYFAKLGDTRMAADFTARAQARQARMTELMWNPQAGLYFDYNVSTGLQKPVKSLAAFIPLWAGLADETQARQVVGNLSLFEHAHGLATCDVDYGYTDRQWSYPYGWAPLHWMVYHGLKRYGYQADAERIAQKWLKLNRDVFGRTFLFWEKYDVVNGEAALVFDRYPAQHGFGWTNGVYLDLVIGEWLNMG